MPNSSVFRFRSLIVHASLILIATLDLGPAQRDKNTATLNTPANRNARRIEALKEVVRHQVVTLPYYTVFDWLEAQVKPDGTVTLMGEVTRPTVKDDAEHRVKKLESVERG